MVMCMKYKNLNSAEEIMNLFLEKNPIDKGVIKSPFLILLDGITGTGKSTVSRIISKKIDIVVLNNDKIRQFIYKTGFSTNWKDIQDLVKKIQYFRIEQTLKKGNNCLLDGNISNNFDSKISIIKKYNIKYYIIRLIYNRELVIDRIKNRKVDIKSLDSINGCETINYSNATVDDFLRMEKEKFIIPKEFIYFEIDTSKNIDDIEKQIDKLVEKLNKENKEK